MLNELDATPLLARELFVESNERKFDVAINTLEYYFARVEGLGPGGIK